MAYVTTSMCSLVDNIIRTGIRTGILSSGYCDLWSDKPVLCNIITTGITNVINTLKPTVNQYATDIAVTLQSMSTDMYASELMTYNNVPYNIALDFAYRMHLNMLMEIPSEFINKYFDNYTDTGWLQDISNQRGKYMLSDTNQYAYPCDNAYSYWWYRDVRYCTGKTSKGAAIYSTSTAIDKICFCNTGNVDSGSTLYGWSVKGSNGYVIPINDGEILKRITMYGNCGYIKTVNYCISDTTKKTYDKDPCSALSCVDNSLVTGRQLARMNYNLNCRYELDHRNKFFTSCWTNWGSDRMYCGSRSISFSKDILESMESKMSNYITLKAMHSRLNYLLCTTTGNNELYAYGKNVVNGISTTYGETSKVDYINNLADTIPFIDHWLDNLSIAGAKDVAVYMYDKMCSWTPNSVTNVTAQCALCKNHIDNSMLKYSNFSTALARSSDTQLVPKLLVEEVSTVTSMSAISSYMSDVYYGGRVIPSILSGFDINNGITNGNNDYGIQVFSANGCILMNTTSIPLSVICVMNIGACSSTTIQRDVSGLRSYDYTELGVITTPNSSSSISSSYYKGVISNSGSLTLTGNVEAATGKVGATNVFILGR